MNKNEYYTLVTSRISEMEEELKNIESELNTNTNSNERERLNLAKEVTKEKIKYLKSIELLPLYYGLQSFRNIKIYDKISRKEIPFEEVEHILGLDNVIKAMKQSKTTTLEYLKELFINDYSSMHELLALQSINFMCRNKIESLYNKGENSIAQILIRERQLSRLESKTNDTIKDLEIDYDFDTLKEINHFIRFNNEKLPLEFINKHKDKIIKNNPLMEKVIKRLTRKEKFNLLSKIFKTKRNKDEEKFINSLIDAYKNDSRLSYFGINPANDLLDNSYTIKKFIKNLNKKISSKKRELEDIRNSLNDIKSNTLNEVKKYETIREENKKDFITLLKSKTNFLPKIFVEQLWNEPELKSSLIKVSCINEENKLLNKISNWFTKPTTKEVNSHQYDIENQSDINIKKLTA